MLAKTEAIVFTIALPTSKAGYDIAIDSSIEIYKKVFGEVKVISLVPDLLSPKEAHHQEIPIKQYKIPQNGKLIRFLKSIVNSCPAVVQQYTTEKAKNIVRNELQKIDKENDLYIIFEDLPIAFFSDLAKKNLPNCKVIIRSHNVLGEIFKGFADGNNLIKALPWKYESDRLKKYEKRQLSNADYRLAISDRDAKKYKELYDLEVDGVLSIGIRDNFTSTTLESSGKNLVYLGTADLRKKHGLQFFIDNIWKYIIKENPSSYFHIGGKNTKELSNVDYNIKGWGFIEDESEFLKNGQLFVNPQLVGSGIKIKSINAMFAGKTLITTTKGIEGVGGENGYHYLIANNEEEFIYTINKMIQNPQEAKKIAISGQKYVKQKFSFDEFVKSKLHEFKDIINDKKL